MLYVVWLYFFQSANFLQAIDDFLISIPLIGRLWLKPLALQFDSTCHLMINRLIFFANLLFKGSFLSFIIIFIVISNSHTMIAIFDQGDCHYWLVWLKFVFTLIANFRLWTQKCFGWWMKFVAKWIWWNVLRSLKGLSKLQVSLL